jgi:hypothetical protein
VFFPFLSGCGIFTFLTLLAQRFVSRERGPRKSCNTRRIGDMFRYAPSGVSVVYAQTVFANRERDDGKEIRGW